VAATLRLKAVRGKRQPAPTVFFVTDPDRTPDPAVVAKRLPRGTGVIFRGFGRPGAERTAAALAAIARARGLVLLIGADERLAYNVGARGVHLPERDLGRARGIRARHPNWLITGAAHSPIAVARAKRSGIDAVLLSTAFSSNSASASLPLGPVRLALIVKGAHVPVIALGGVTGRTSKRLIGTGVWGLAAVDGLSS
jgi:thiamine-phosphate pyrophosphorylase